MDLSEKRLCEVRCFGTNDDMSNWAPKPKFMLAEGDTYMKRPDDDTYSLLAVNYLKLDKVPAYNESWAPIVEGIHEGQLLWDDRRDSLSQLGNRRLRREERLHGQY